MRTIVICFCNDIRHLGNEINKRGGGIFLWRVEFFKIGKRGLHVYKRDESTGLWSRGPLKDLKDSKLILNESKLFP